jgi:hypothetical protein
MYCIDELREQTPGDSCQRWRRQEKEWTQGHMWVSHLREHYE